jgi:alpha-glucosidase (family GH31 glycosyl hydrolase)
MVVASGVLVGAAPAHAEAVDAGALRAVATTDPFELRFVDAGGTEVLSQASSVDAGPAGTIGYERAGAWYHATRALGIREADGAIAAILRTTDPAGGTIALRATRAADGVIRVQAAAPAEATAVGIGFDRRPGERFLGFGERSDAAVRTTGSVESRVTEGPYQPIENPFIAAFVPLPGYNARADATYFPIPWLLSTRGYGVLVEGDETTRHHLGSPWSTQTDGARLTFDVFAGPTPAQALERFTAHVGRQPAARAPFFFGPWWQPAGADAQNVETLRKAGALGSVAQTYTHYLPCGSQQGAEAAQRERTARLHAAGLAVTTYFNPMICTTYEPRYSQAAARGVLTKDATGQPYVYRYTGASQFLVSQFDFSAPGATAFYGDLLDEAVQHGYDGWMEDFGEYTPTDSHAAEQSSGTAMHNRYAALYHGAAWAYQRDRAPRRLARFNRSGWTGAAAASQIVWGGDPSTGWGFDGLASAVRNGLTMGASGVSLWGSDIGGYFALSLPQTTPDLERRWIEAGFAQGVMRTEADGFSLVGGNRAQIFDADVLPVWARYARLRTQLYPYLEAAQRTYDATGLPIMRQLALVDPDDERGATRDDEYRFGPDLLVAPVLEPDATSRRLYLPRGRWIDFWRSATLDADGAPRLTAPRVLDGGDDVSLPAPADQLPLLVREGAIVPLLPADVQTLSDYGEGVVHLRDRARRRTLLAWPARGAAAVAHPTDDATVRSTLRRDGRWVLRISQQRRRRYDLQVALARRPCRLEVAGRRVRFAYADGVLRASVRVGSGAVVARSRCASG